GNNIEINNNYWSPVLPTNAYQAGWPANVIEKNMTTHQGYRSFNFRIDEFFDPHYVVGTMASPTSTCPVSTWSDPITDPINFNPTSVPEFTIATADAEVVYIDRPFDLDELDIDNPVSTVTAGVYSGQNFGIAFNTAVGGLTEPTLDEEQNTVYTPYSPGLLNMADLLVNTAWAATKEELEIFNYGYSKYLGCLEKALTLNVFEGNTQIETNQLNAALSVFTAIETYNAQFELTQPTRYYDKRIAIGIDKTHVYRMFNQYANALTTLNTLSSFASATDAMPINYLICHTDNEKKLFNSEINWLEFESAVFNCTSVFGNNNQFGFTTDSTFWQDTLTWDSTNQLGLTFTMAPNPATTQITVDIALNVAGVVKVAIFDTYGIKVVNDISLGSLSTGNHQTTVPLTGLTPGVYAMVVYLDDV
ncbi:MAG TPA: T9SS type A sorting domain-containing protein, partial [Bacillota bacterium]|nr:T9SS type A sorting domain-containing protein [Bacillota bacterium]